MNRIRLPVSWNRPLRDWEQRQLAMVRRHLERLVKLKTLEICAGGVDLSVLLPPSLPPVPVSSKRIEARGGAGEEEEYRPPHVSKDVTSHPDMGLQDSSSSCLVSTAADASVADGDQAFPFQHLERLECDKFSPVLSLADAKQLLSRCPRLLQVSGLNIAYEAANHLREETKRRRAGCASDGTSAKNGSNSCE